MRCVLFVLLLSSIMHIPFTERGFSQEIGAVKFLGHYIPPIGGSYVAGCWGWTDTSGREYAILGSFSGTSIVEITNPGAMVERDFVPGPSSGWREIQVYSHYAYVGTEGGGGTQIIDLAYLPDSVHLVKSFTYTLSGKNTAASHTLHISGSHMYLSGCSGWTPGGIVIFSLADPINPSYVGQYARNYIHDCYVHGDTLYGAAINGQGIDIIDITNKSNPIYRRSITYPGSGTHNISTTTDGRYVLSTDEIGTTAKTLKIWDMQSGPPTPKVAEYVGSPTATVHNVFVKNNLAIMSYYTAGMRVVDITNPASPVEIGGYDTYVGDPSGYDGAWSVYPYFPSGKIIIGDMETGLYVVEVNLNGPATPTGFAAASDFQTPTSALLTWDDPTQLVSGAPLSDFVLHIYRGATLIAEVDSGVESYTDVGLTNHQNYSYSIRAVTATESSAVRTASVYAGGHAQSQAPSSFQAIDGTDGSHLSWVNPSRQLDNTPLNDFASIRIYRDGILFDSLSQSQADTGQFRTYLDTTEGYHSYYIQVKDNETPVYYSPATAAITSYGKIKTNFVEGFDGVLPPLLKTGNWGTSNFFSTSSPNSLADSPPDYYQNNSSSYVIMPPVILGSNPMLQFKHIAIIAFGDFGFLEISNNRRQSWAAPLKVYNWTAHPEWQDGTADQSDWFIERLDLSAYAGDTVNIRFRLVTNGSVTADGWYVDDITIGPAQQVGAMTSNVTTGWNMLSLPVKVVDSAASSLFPGASSDAFSYSGGYSIAESLRFGKGYWLKFDSAASFLLSGSTTLKDTIDVEAKWNMIGVISDSLDTNKVRSIPTGIIKSPYYFFNGGYSAVKKLAPGRAYWVKTSQAGKVILSAFNNKTAPDNSDEGSRTSALGLLRFVDAAGHSQTLSLSRTGGSSQSLDWYDLPPMPPSGAFDVRFGSQRSLELVGNTPEIFPINLQGVEYPLTMEWDGDPAEGTEAFLGIDGLETSISATGKVTLHRPVASIVLRVVASSPGGRAPGEFALHQNYPNPFNPSTTISFDLPRESRVTIKVYSLLGEEVATLLDGMMEAGAHVTEWNAARMASGVYYYRIQARDLSGATFTQTRKLLLAR